MYTEFQEYLKKELAQIDADGLYKRERIIESAQGAEIMVAGKKCLNFCANNYLGLADNPELIQAAKEGMDARGFGMASVRFICGCQDLHKTLEKKIADFKQGKYTFRFAEFGCRRRLSREWEEVVVRRLATETQNCVGTSNVYLAWKLGLTPIGTYAHEFVQMYQGIDAIPLAYTNHYAMQDWYNEYQGDNGTALTDTVTTDLFLLDFNRSMVNNYTGVRHDSGDPYEWGEKIIAHYKKYGVDPKTKLLLFSDSLDFDRAQKLYEYFREKTKVSFGIGTFCSNDTCAPALNIVIKLQYVNGRPVAKLSDTPGKAMCRDTEYLEYLKRSVAFRIDREKGNKK